MKITWSKDDGYVCFFIAGQVAVGWLEDEGTHNIILREAPSVQTDDPHEASRTILGALRKAGGDVKSLVADSTLQLPL